MATATATLRFYRQSPRKVRLVADLVKGKTADEAVDILRFTTKRSAKPIRKLIESARANANNKGLSSDLVVKTIAVDEGATLKRGQPRAMGQMNLIRKRTCHINVELAEREPAEATATAASDTATS